MENLNAEQIKKALKCCADTSDIMKCQSCPYIQPRSGCITNLVRDTLALINSQEQRIKELAEDNKWSAKRIIETDKMVLQLNKENERLQDLVKEVQEYNEAWVKDNHDLRAENERLRADTLENIKIEFAMRFGTYTDKDQVKIADVFTLLDQIAKEMLN